MILQALARLIGEVALWVGLVLVTAAAVALGARRAFGRGEGSAWRGLGAAFVGSLLVAGVADRLGLPDVLVIDIGRRPLSLAWVVAGAVAGAAAFWIGARTRARASRG